LSYYSRAELAAVDTGQMLINLPDEQLVEIAVGENPDAFGEIVRRWERKMFALCFGMTGRRVDRGGS